MRYTIVHAADLHLDSPLLGLERYEGAPVEQVRGASRRALENLVQLCLDEDAKLLLIAGDLYDGDWRDYTTGLFFAAQMARLAETGTRVVWIRGNHDAQSKVTRHLPLPSHCVELGTRKAETHLVDDLNVAVHGRGFATRAVTEDLSASYPPPIAGALNIGLLHTALSGRRGHAAYAPCDVKALEARGYDYWALGHVHQREVVQEAPYVVFPGNLQGRHVRECGPKGATLVRVRDDAIISVEPRVLDVARFARLDVDVSAASDASDAVELSVRALRESMNEAEGRPLCARVALTGRTPAHGALLADPERTRALVQSRANEIQGGDAWVESVRFETSLPIDLDALAQREDSIGQVVRALSVLETDADARGALLAELSEVERALPYELRLAELGIALDDDEATGALMRDVSRRLLPRLLEEP
ncbi:MAG: DNA repair exonuclease [Polyangiales bacterium]